MLKYGLSEKQLQEIQGIIASYDAVEEAILFGSRAIDTYKEASDIDIAIKGEKVDWSLAMTIKDHFEEETYLPFFFDVVAYNSIQSDELRQHIDRKGKALFSRRMSEWRECALKEVAEVQTGPFGSQLKNEQYITGGTPVITVEHIKNFRIVDFDYPSVTDEEKNRLAKYLLKAGDIIFTRVGSVDLSAFVQPYQDGWMFSSRMLRVRPSQKVDSRFLSYFFQQNRFREYILNISVGATMPSINTEILKGLPVSYPPLPEQKAIAEVLSSLDDKIDLLHRQNKTLEQMAETLFRQWFVEEAGEDWEFTSFSKWILETVGGDWGKEKAEGDFLKPVICIRGTDIANLNIGLADKAPIRYVKEVKFEKIEPKNGDIIIEISGGTETQSTGRATYINDDVRKLFNYPLAFSNFSRLIRISKPEYSYFIYCYFQYLYKKNEFFNLENGSSGIKNLDYKALLFELEFFMPEESLVIKFNSNVSSYFKKINKNKTQIRTLESLRDTLLPKLMSGEVRIASNG